MFAHPLEQECRRQEQLGAQDLGASDSFGPAGGAGVDRGYMRAGSNWSTSTWVQPEAGRFGQRQEAAARDLGDRLREEAIQRFCEGRELLGRAKGILRDYSAATLRAQVNEAMGANVLGDVHVQYSGIHVWTVSFRSHPEYRGTYGREFVIHLELGPSAWHDLNKGRWQDAAFEPDYTRIIILEDRGGAGAIQSDVSLAEVIEGLAIDDNRLRDEIVGLIDSTS